MTNYYEYFSRVKIPESLKGKISQTDPENPISNKIEYLENTSKVNIFVGPNNSGKSRFLREILDKFDSHNYQMTNLFRVELIKRLSENKVELSKPFYYNTIPSHNNANSKFYPIYIARDFNQYLAELIKNIENNPSDLYDKIYGKDGIIPMLSNKNTNFQVKAYDHFSGSTNVIELDKSEHETISEWFRSQFSELFELLETNNPKFKEIDKIYIPNIRTLKNYSDHLKFDVYKFEKSDYPIYKHTKDKYFKDSEDVEILDGQALYLDIFNIRNSTNDNLEKMKNFQIFLSKLFFQGKNVDLITDVKNHQIKIKVGNEQERLIHEVGDGVQQMIMLTYPLFFKDCGIIVIEEPEMWLHPGLQKTLMEIFLSEDLAIEYKYSKDFIFFIATHSNHILDVDKHKELISIYTVEKESDKENPNLIINNIANQDIRILDLIGVSNSSVYLANCAIWVEGSTDKLYLGKYLEETIKHIKNDENHELHEKLNKFKLNEGINYTFAFSAGNSIFNLDFSEDGEYDKIEKDIITRFLTNKALVITDHDQNKNSDLKQKLKEKLGENYIELGANEIENLLTSEVIVKAIKDTWQNKITPDQEVEIYNILNEESSINQTNTKLGKFLDSKLLSKMSELGFTIISFKADSDTIKSKTKFCNCAIEHINYENMSTEAKEVAMKILDFILESNNLKN